VKLTLQIAGGILIASAVGWWLSIVLLAGGMHEIAKDMQNKPAPRIGAISIPVATHNVSKPKGPTRPPCENFVQMQNGDRHCLENEIRGSFIVGAQADSEIARR
jgi:hypothetical protein